MKLSDDIRKKLEIKLDILENGDDIFLDEIKKLEKSFFSKVLGILRKFSTKAGKLVNDETNNQLLLKIREGLVTALKESTLTSKTRQFLTNFDKVQELSKDILEDVSKVSYSKIASTVNATQKEYVEELTSALLSQKAQDAGMIKPVQKIMFRQITTGISLKQAEDELRNFIKTDERRLGHLSRYVRTYAMDAINRFDGEINQQAQAEFDLDGFSYVGSLIATSRPFCRHIIEGSGALSKYEIKGGINDGLYRVEDLPEIIRYGRGTRGFIRDTTPQNFFVLRGGYGCRHSIIPVRLLEEDEN